MWDFPYFFLEIKITFMKLSFYNMAPNFHLFIENPTFVFC